MHSTSRRSTHRWHRRLGATLFAILATASCGDGGGGGGTPPPTPTITLALSAASLSVQPGQNGAVTATLTRGGGYAGAVNLTLEGAPSGVTGTFQPASLVTGVTSSTLNIAVGAGVAAGSYPLTVRASGDGVAAQTAALALTVASAGGFSLAVSPSPATLPQGGAANATVTITRTGSFTGAVALTVTGAPQGLTATLNPASVTGATSTLALSAAANLAPNNYTLTIQGTASGLPNQSANLTVQVQASGGGGTGVTWRRCDSDPLPLWFAVQSEAGAWTRVTPTGSTFTFNVGERGGVALVERVGTANEYETSIFYGTAAELVAMGNQGCEIAGGTGGKRLTGSVAGLSATSQASIQMGGAGASASAGEPAFTLENVADGPQDLIAARSEFSIGESGISFVADRMIIRRGLNLPNNGVIPTLDFGAAEAFEPVARALTLNGLGSDQALVSLAYLTSTSSASALGGTAASYFFTFTGSASSTYYGVPAARQAAGDLHMLSLFAGDFEGAEGPSSLRGSFSFFTTAVDRTVNLPPQLSAPTISVLGTSPYVRLRAQLARQAEYASLASFAFSQPTRSVTINATAAYVGAAAWDVSIPDFTGVTGFEATWGLQAGTLIQWSANLFGADGTLTQFFTPTDGATWRLGVRNGELMP